MNRNVSKNDEQVPNNVLSNFFVSEVLFCLLTSQILEEWMNDCAIDEFIGLNQKQNQKSVLIYLVLTRKKNKLKL
jgi:hypothetical protein